MRWVSVYATHRVLEMLDRIVPFFAEDLPEPAA
ncbi:hypothetical protein J2S42_007371 [Catenuloplanes indicus]|uniref:Uncharacterized protein n=1 Tax=Catenuloplanes indicus TaxID=137267 RepID=A0AAE3W931_9ACTN|nr:hypothetical protein [Catenuloplanes indicus]